MERVGKTQCRFKHIAAQISVGRRKTRAMLSTKDHGRERFCSTDIVIVIKNVTCVVAIEKFPGHLNSG